MTAKIIELASYRRSGVRCPALRITFPQVYRVQGYSWLDETMSGPDLNHPGLAYALSEDPCGMTATTCTPIDRLDPAVDDGWLLIDHHRNDELFDGYIRACLEFADNLFDTGAACRTDQGIFTIYRRPARKSAPNHLIIYSAMVPYTGPAPFSWDYWQHAIDHNGDAVPEDVWNVREDE